MPQGMSTPRMELFDAYTVRKVRERYMLSPSHQGSIDGVYNIEFPYATKKRSTCRACGEIISKGTQVIRVAYDFRGSGSWTAVQCVMHVDCPGAQKQEQPR